MCTARNIIKCGKLFLLAVAPRIQRTKMRHNSKKLLNKISFATLLLVLFGLCFSMVLFGVTTNNFDFNASLTPNNAENIASAETVSGPKISNAGITNGNIDHQNASITWNNWGFENGNEWAIESNAYYENNRLKYQDDAVSQCRNAYKFDTDIVTYLIVPNGASLVDLSVAMQHWYDCSVGNFHPYCKWEISVGNGNVDVNGKVTNFTGTLVRTGNQYDRYANGWGAVNNDSFNDIDVSGGQLVRVSLKNWFTGSGLNGFRFGVFIDKLQAAFDDNGASPTAPTQVTLSSPANASGWHKNDVTLTVSGAIDYDGIQKYQYLTDGAVWNDCTGTNKNQLTLSSSINANALRFRAIDNANESTGAVYTYPNAIKIDKSIPSIVQDHPGGADKTDRTFTVTDSGNAGGISGIAKVEYTRNGGATQTLTTFITGSVGDPTVTFSVTSGGLYVFTVYDIAGNVSAQLTATVISYYSINPTTGNEGSGSAADPYILSNFDDFKTLSTIVNNGNNYLGKYFKVLAPNGNNNIIDFGTNLHIPIGNNYDTHIFKGHIDGNSQTLIINNIQATTSHVGLFGFIGYGATIKDLTLSGSFNANGQSYVGGLVAEMHTGDTTKIENCVSNVVITNALDYVGGIVGIQHAGEVSGCTNNGKVVGNDYVGGIVGWAKGTLSGTFTNTGAISGRNYGGGIFGYLGRSDLPAAAYTLTLTSNVSTALNADDDGIAFVSYFGGAIGYISSNVTLNGTITVLGKDVDNSTGNCGIMGGVVGFNGGTINAKMESSVRVIARGADVSIVHNSVTYTGAIVGGLVGFNAGTINGDNSERKLGDVISAKSGKNDFIGGAVGINIGVLSNVKVSANSTVGFIGNSNFFGDYVGGVVGYSVGSISQCANYAEVHGGQYSGGIVGRTTGTIANCYNGGKVVSTSNNVGGIVGNATNSVNYCANIGEVTGAENVGGIVGNSSSTIDYCFNLGVVSGTTANKVGGIAGLGGTITNSVAFYYGNKTANHNSLAPFVENLLTYSDGGTTKYRLFFPMLVAGAVYTAKTWEDVLTTNLNGFGVENFTVASGKYVEFLNGNNSNSLPSNKTIAHNGTDHTVSFANLYYNVNFGQASLHLEILDITPTITNNVFSAGVYSYSFTPNAGLSTNFIYTTSTGSLVNNKPYNTGAYTLELQIKDGETIVGCYYSAFNITANDIQNTTNGTFNIAVTSTGLVYNGAEQSVTFIVTWNFNGSDYVWTWNGSAFSTANASALGDCFNAPTNSKYTNSSWNGGDASNNYNLSLTAKNNFTGTKSATWQIAQKNIGDGDIVFANQSTNIYSAAAQTFTFNLVWNNPNASEASYTLISTEYGIKSGSTLTHTNSSYVGENGDGVGSNPYHFKLTGSGNYTGEKDGTWVIQRKNISDANKNGNASEFVVSLTQYEFAYKRSAYNVYDYITVAWTGHSNLVKNTEFTLTGDYQKTNVKNDVNNLATNYVYQVVGQGNFDGTTSYNYDGTANGFNWKITKKSIRGADFVIAVTSTHTYNGLEQTVQFTVTWTSFTWTYDGSNFTASDTSAVDNCFTVSGHKHTNSSFNSTHPETPRNAGNNAYTFTVTAINNGNFEGGHSQEWQILQKSLTDNDIYFGYFGNVGNNSLAINKWVQTNNYFSLNTTNDKVLALLRKSEVYADAGFTSADQSRFKLFQTVGASGRTIASADNGAEKDDFDVIIVNNGLVNPSVLTLSGKDNYTSNRVLYAWIMDSDFGGGNGTSVNPYIIRTWQQAVRLSEITNGVNHFGIVATAWDSDSNGISNAAVHDYNGRYFKLADEIVSDLDLKGFSLAVADTYGFEPIGTVANPFRGNFNGNNKAILINIDNTIKDYVGLFGVFDGGDISNLTVKGIVNGKNFVGGIVGRHNSGTLYNVTNMSAVSATNYAGGLVGYMKRGNMLGIFKNTGSISGRDFVGGLVGCAEPGVGTQYNNESEYTFGVNVVGTGVNKTYTHSILRNEGAITGANKVAGLIGGFGVEGSGNITGFTIFMPVSQNTGNVTASGQYVAGLIGYTITALRIELIKVQKANTYGNNNALIPDILLSYNGFESVDSMTTIIGQSIVGGLIGDLCAAAHKFDNVFNTGIVSGTSTTGIVGGLIGNISGGNPTISNSFVMPTMAVVDDKLNDNNDTNIVHGKMSVVGSDLVDTSTKIGGIVGNANSGNILNCYTLGFRYKNVTADKGGIAGYAHPTNATIKNSWAIYMVDASDNNSPYTYSSTNKYGESVIIGNDIANLMTFAEMKLAVGITVDTQANPVDRIASSSAIIIKKNYISIKLSLLDNKQLVFYDGSGYENFSQYLYTTNPNDNALTFINSVVTVNDNSDTFVMLRFSDIIGSFTVFATPVKFTNIPQKPKPTDWATYYVRPCNMDNLYFVNDVTETNENGGDGKIHNYINGNVIYNWRTQPITKNLETIPGTLKPKGEVLDIEAKPTGGISIGSSSPNPITFGVDNIVVPYLNASCWNDIFALFKKWYNGQLSVAEIDAYMALAVNQGVDRTVYNGRQNRVENTEIIYHRNEDGSGFYAFYDYVKGNEIDNGYRLQNVKIGLLNRLEYSIGDEMTPLLIKDQTDWNDLVQNVKNGNSYYGQYVRFADDVASVMDGTFSTTSSANDKYIDVDISNLAGYAQPDIDINNNTLGANNAAYKGFQGTFDGNGKTIRVRIDQSAQTTNTSYLAIFPYASGTIKNLTIEGYITTKYDDTNYGFDVAAFVAQPTGNLSLLNCTNKANITARRVGAGIVAKTGGQNVSMIDCINYGYITTYQDMNITNNSSVSTTGSAGEFGTGGIISTVNGGATVLDSCKNFGKIRSASNAGGIVGLTSSALTITNSANEGEVRAQKIYDRTDGSWYKYIQDYHVDKISNAGGILGCATFSGSIKAYACYNSGDIIAGCLNAGGIVGADTTVTNSDTSSTNSPITPIANNVGSEIKYCYNTGNVYAGSKAESNQVTNTDTSLADKRDITADCYYAGNDIDSAGCGGGIMGVSSKSDIQFCYNTGKVFANGFSDGDGAVGQGGIYNIMVGGILGHSSASNGAPVTVKYCYNIGQVQLNYGYDGGYNPGGAFNSRYDRRYIGGIVGCHQNADAVYNTTTYGCFALKNCVYDPYVQSDKPKYIDYLTGSYGSFVGDANWIRTGYRLDSLADFTSVHNSDGTIKPSSPLMTKTYEERRGDVGGATNALLETYVAFPTASSSSLINSSGNYAVTNAYTNGGGFVYPYGCLPQLAIFALDTETGLSMLSKTYNRNAYGNFIEQTAGSELSPYVIKDGVDMLCFEALTNAQGDGSHWTGKNKYIEFATAENNIAKFNAFKINMPDTEANKSNWYTANDNGAKGKNYYILNRGAVYGSDFNSSANLYDAWKLRNNIYNYTISGNISGVNDYALGNYTNGGSGTEDITKLFDKNTNTKYCVAGNIAFVVGYSSPKFLNTFTWTTANDTATNPNRNLKECRIYGTNDSTLAATATYTPSNGWTKIYENSAMFGSFTAENYKAFTFNVADYAEPYRYYLITGSSQGDPFQMSELSLTIKGTGLTDANFFPIANASDNNVFEGIFSGKKSDDTNTYLKDVKMVVGLSEQNSTVGLFGKINNAIIRNITMTGSLTATHTASSGTSAVGAYVGVAYNNSTLKNLQLGILNGAIRVPFNVTSLTKASSIISDNVEDYVGGIVGKAETNLKNSKLYIQGCTVFSGNVTGYKRNVGGILGYATGLKDTSVQFEHCKFLQGVVKSIGASAHTSVGSRIGGIMGSQDRIEDYTETKGITSSFKDCSVGDSTILTPQTAENSKAFIYGESAVGGITSLGNATTGFMNCAVYGDVYIERKPASGSKPANTRKRGTSFGGIVGYTENTSSFNGNIGFYGTIDVDNAISGQWTNTLDGALHNVSLTNVGGIVGSIGDGGQTGKGATFKDIIITVRGKILANSLVASEVKQIGGLAGRANNSVFDGQYDIAPEILANTATDVGGFIGINEGECVIIANQFTNQAGDKVNMAIVIGGAIVGKENVGGFLGYNKNGSTIKIGLRNYLGVHYNGTLMLTNSAFIDGKACIGGIVGKNDALLSVEDSNIKNTGKVGTNVVSVGTLNNNVPTNFYYGGVIGLNDENGNLYFSQNASLNNEGQVGVSSVVNTNYIFSNSYQFYIGGILGASKGQVNIACELINKGWVYGYSNVGGTIGTLEKGSISGKYTNYGNVIGYSYVGGIIAVMKKDGVVTNIGNNNMSEFENSGEVYAAESIITEQVLENNVQKLVVKSSTHNEFNVFVGGSIALYEGAINLKVVDGNITTGKSAKFYNTGKVFAYSFAGGSIGILAGSIDSAVFTSQGLCNFYGAEAVGGAIGIIANSEASALDSSLNNQPDVTSQTTSISNTTFEYLGVQGVKLNAGLGLNSASTSSLGGIGGLIGVINANEINSNEKWLQNTFYVTGDVEAPNCNNVGGVVGSIDGGAYITIKNMLAYHTSVSGNTNVGGIIGYNNSLNHEQGENASLVDCYNIEGNITYKATNAKAGGIVGGYGEFTYTYSSYWFKGFNNVSLVNANISDLGSTLTAKWIEVYNVTRMNDDDDYGNIKAHWGAINVTSWDEYFTYGNTLVNGVQNGFYKEDGATLFRTILYKNYNGDFGYYEIGTAYSTGNVHSGYYTVYANDAGTIAKSNINVTHHDGVNNTDLLAWKYIANAYNSDEIAGKLNNTIVNSNIIQTGVVQRRTLFATSTAATASGYYMFIASSGNPGTVKFDQNSDKFFVEMPTITAVGGATVEAENLILFYRKANIKKNLMYNGKLRYSPVNVGGADVMLNAPQNTPEIGTYYAVLNGNAGVNFGKNVGKYGVDIAIKFVDSNRVDCMVGTVKSNALIDSEYVWNIIKRSTTTLGGVYNEDKALVTVNPKATPYSSKYKYVEFIVAGIVGADMIDGQPTQAIDFDFTGNWANMNFSTKNTLATMVDPNGVNTSHLNRINANYSMSQSTVQKDKEFSCTQSGEGANITYAIDPSATNVYTFTYRVFAKDRGDYNISIRRKAVGTYTDNYTAQGVEQSFIISAAALTVTYNDNGISNGQTYEYNGKVQSVISLTINGVQPNDIQFMDTLFNVTFRNSVTNVTRTPNGTTYTINENSKSILAATYYFVVSLKNFNANTSNYTFGSGANAVGAKQYYWTISKKIVNISLETGSKTFTYDGTTHTFGFSIDGHTTAGDYVYPPTSDTIRIPANCINYSLNGTSYSDGATQAGVYTVSFNANNITASNSTVPNNRTDSYEFVVQDASATRQITITPAKLMLNWSVDSSGYVYGSGLGPVLSTVSCEGGAAKAVSNLIVSTIGNEKVTFRVNYEGGNAGRGKVATASIYAVSGTNSAGLNSVVANYTIYSGATTTYDIIKSQLKVVVTDLGNKVYDATKNFDGDKTTLVYSFESTNGGSGADASVILKNTWTAQFASVNVTNEGQKVNVDFSNLEIETNSNFELSEFTTSANVGKVIPRTLHITLNLDGNSFAKKIFDGTNVFADLTYTTYNAVINSNNYRTGRGFSVTNFAPNEDINANIKIRAKFKEIINERSIYDSYVNGVYSTQENNTTVYKKDDAAYFKKLVFTLENTTNYNLVADDFISAPSTVLSIHDTASPQLASGQNAQSTIRIAINSAQVTANYENAQQSYVNEDNTFRTEWLDVLGSLNKFGANVQLLITNGWKAGEGGDGKYTKETTINGTENSAWLGAKLTSVNGYEFNCRLINQPTLFIGYFSDDGNAYKITSVSGLLLANYYYMMNFDASALVETRYELRQLLPTLSGVDYVLTGTIHDGTAIPSSIKGSTPDECIQAFVLWYNGRPERVGNIEVTFNAETGQYEFYEPYKEKMQSYLSFKLSNNINGILSDNDIAVLNGTFNKLVNGNNVADWGYGYSYLQNCYFAKAGSILTLRGALFLGTFIGAFDGNGYVIENLNVVQSVSSAMTQTINVGLFNNLGNSYSYTIDGVEKTLNGLGKVQNIHLRNTNIQVFSTSSALLNVGGIVGYSHSSTGIKNSSFQGKISVNAQNATVNVGAIVGLDMSAPTDNIAVEKAIVIAEISVSANIANVGAVVGALRTENKLSNTVSMSEIIISATTQGLGALIGRVVPAVVHNNTTLSFANGNLTPSETNVFVAGSSYVFLNNALVVEGTTPLYVAKLIGNQSEANSLDKAKTYTELRAGSASAYGQQVVEGAYDVLPFTNTPLSANETARTSMRFNDIVDVYLLKYSLTEQTVAMEGGTSTGKIFTKSATSYLVGNKTGTDNDRIQITTSQQYTLLKILRFASFNLTANVVLIAGNIEYGAYGVFVGSVTNNTFTVNVRAWDSGVSQIFKYQVVGAIPNGMIIVD